MENSKKFFYCFYTDDYNNVFNRYFVLKSESNDKKIIQLKRKMRTDLTFLKLSKELVSEQDLITIKEFIKRGLVDGEYNFAFIKKNWENSLNDMGDFPENIFNVNPL